MLKAGADVLLACIFFLLVLVVRHWTSGAPDVTFGVSVEEAVHVQTILGCALRAFEQVIESTDPPNEKHVLSFSHVLDVNLTAGDKKLDTRFLIRYAGICIYTIYPETEWKLELRELSQHRAGSELVLEIGFYGIRYGSNTTITRLI